MDQNEVQYIQTAMNRPDIAKTDHEFFINKGIEIYYIVRFVESFKPFKNVKVLKGVLIDVLKTKMNNIHFRLSFNRIISKLPSRTI